MAKSKTVIPAWFAKSTETGLAGWLWIHSPKMKTPGLRVCISLVNSCQNQFGMCFTVSTRSASTPLSSHILIAPMM